MLVRYLNLDRRPERDQRFLQINRYIADFQRIPAVDGGETSREKLVAAQLIDSDLQHYSPGALGNAASHRQLWLDCAKGRNALTFAEDDAVFNRRFSTIAESVLQQLPADWDIILWGWNFDSVLHVEMFGGLNETVLTFARPQLGPAVGRFQDLSPDARPLRLIHAFGLVCYSISPQGAARLLERCFPLRNEIVSVPGLRANIHNISLDTAMNKHFRELQAYVSFPPLVWTENDRGESDVCGTRSR